MLTRAHAALAVLAAGALAVPTAHADDPPPSGPDPTASEPVDPSAPPTTPPPPPLTEIPPPPPAPRADDLRPSVIVREEPPRAIVREQRDVVRTWNAPLFGAGLVTFGLGYGGAVIAAASSDDGSLDRLYVPVLGPWLALDQRPDCPVEQARCDRDTSIKALLVADGVLQGAGVITMATGLIVPREYTVIRRDDTRVKLQAKVTASVGPKMTGLILKGDW